MALRNNNVTSSLLYFLPIIRVKSHDKEDENY